MSVRGPASPATTSTTFSACAAIRLRAPTSPDSAAIREELPSPQHGMAAPPGGRDTDARPLAGPNRADLRHQFRRHPRHVAQNDHGAVTVARNGLKTPAQGRAEAIREILVINESDRQSRTGFFDYPVVMARYDQDGSSARPVPPPPHGGPAVSTNIGGQLVMAHATESPAASTTPPMRGAGLRVRRTCTSSARMEMAISPGLAHRWPGRPARVSCSNPPRQIPSAPALPAVGHACVSSPARRYKRRRTQRRDHGRIVNLGIMRQRDQGAAGGERFGHQRFFRPFPRQGHARKTLIGGIGRAGS